MSSSPGQTRSARASYSARRASSSRGGGSASAPPGRWRMLRALEVAALGDPVVGDHGVGELAEAGASSDLADLGRGPDVEASLDPLGVGVQRGEEAALRPAHLGQHPVERALADGPPALVAERLVAVQVGAGEERVVVEHLLEVGDEPAGVDRVAGEAAADLVVDPAGGHRVEGELDDLALPAREQQLERRGRRELRRARRSRRWLMSAAARSCSMAASTTSAPGSSSPGSSAADGRQLAADARRGARGSARAGSPTTGRPPPSPS